MGAGPAGFAAAVRAHDLGKRVALVERSRLGGAGIHDGALSSKTLWHLSNDYSRACRHDRGFSAGELQLSYRAVMAAVHAATAEADQLLARQLEQLAAPDPRGACVELHRGAGRFVSPHAVEVQGGGGAAPRLVEADHFLIATGSRPRTLDGIPIDGERIVTSDHIEHWSEFPDSMVIVGAGVVGCEYATVFANFGRTAIEIIDRQPRILPFEDDDVAACVAASFEAMGIEIHREARLESLRPDGDGVEYVIRTPAGVETRRVARALISVGRVPNLEELGLAAAGVATDRTGVVAAATQTSVPHIWAAGDVTADVALANIGELEGRHAVERMFGLDPPPIHYEALSVILFLRPEVASVGLSERAACERGVRHRVGVISNRLIRRNIAMRATDGFVKLIADPDDGRILGMRVCGPQASSCIQGIALLMEHGGTLTDLDRCVHPHPAITEGVQECARLLLGRSLYKPSVFGPELIRLGGSV